MGDGHLARVVVGGEGVDHGGDSVAIGAFSGHGSAQFVDGAFGAAGAHLGHRRHR